MSSEFDQVYLKKLREFKKEIEEGYDSPKIFPGWLPEKPKNNYEKAIDQAWEKNR